jgi:hypothetical protein
VTYELAVSRFDRADRAAAALRLRDAYLEAWSRDGSPAALRETFTLAVWVGYVTRALDFVDMLRGANTALIHEWQGHVVVLLRRWEQAHAFLNQGERLLAAIEPSMPRAAPWQGTSGSRARRPGGSLPAYLVRSS